MARFKTPDFSERSAAANAAKQAALEQLRNKAAPDAETVARRQAAEAARQAAAADRRAARQAQAEEEKARQAAAAAAIAAAAPPVEEVRVEEPMAERVARTAAEMKAVRDARYAARKARQR